MCSLLAPVEPVVPVRRPTRQPSQSVAQPSITSASEPATATVAVVDPPTAGVRMGPVAEPLFPLQFARNRGNQSSHFPLGRTSLCCTRTLSSLLGQPVLSVKRELTPKVVERGEEVYAEGWHSAQQVNAALKARWAGKGYSDWLRDKKTWWELCRVPKTPSNRSVEYSANELLREQRVGLFMVQAKVRSQRSVKYVSHYVGIDFNRRELIDPYLQQRRPLNEQQWKLVGVVDWQCTYLLCERLPGKKNQHGRT